MERVLREPLVSEVDELFSRAFDLSAGVIYFPVRHHSPICAFQLCKVIELYRPEILLIEGPSDACDLIEPMADPLSVPPFCIYYSYDDQEGLVDEKREKYRAYYPFLEFSPEYAAIKQASEKKIPVEFIDLPYAASLVNMKSEIALQIDLCEEPEYETNLYTKMLAEKSGCRSFDEFWENRFEMEGTTQSPDKFVRSMMALGYYMRQAGSADLDRTRNLMRERFMAERIAQSAKKYQRVMVVAGAYHIAGLLSPKENFPPCKKHQTKSVGAYLMPYTFRETDRLSGYGAGIPFPAYYQKIWEKLHVKKEKCPYEKIALDYIIKTARKARKSHPVTLPDEIYAFQMVCALADLRGKSAPGVYELLDGVRSTFVKGEVGVASGPEQDFLLALLSGMGAGRIASSGRTPPIVHDFRAMCAKYRIKSGTIERQETILDIVKNPLHTQKSQFLHQMRFLETDFAQWVSGPNYVENRDRNLVREKWIIRYGVQVETKLIDLSVFGITIAQASASLLQKKLYDCFLAQKLGKLLLAAQVMGLDDFLVHHYTQITQIIESDQNFLSRCALLADLRELAGIQHLNCGQIIPELIELIRWVFVLAVREIPVIKQVGTDEEQSVCEQLKALHTLTIERPEWCDQRLFEGHMSRVLADTFCNCRVYGTCLAIHHKQGILAMGEFCDRITSWLESTAQLPDEIASFICGVFLVGKDALFYDPEVLTQIDRAIAQMGDETFLSVLPNLRYAFTSFLPAELSRIGGLVADLHHLSPDAIKVDESISEQTLKQGIMLDGLAAREMEKWGI